MKLAELFEGKKLFDQSFVVYLYSKKEIKKDFPDQFDLEDIFDDAHLSATEPDNIAGGLLNDTSAAIGKKIPSLSKAEKIAFNNAKYVISIMDQENLKKFKSKFTLIAQEWSKKIAPYIVAVVKNSINA